MAREIGGIYHPKLEFIADLRIDGEKELICALCEDSASGPSYKCSGCGFLCHQSCGEMPGEIEHLLHPNHTLELIPPARNIYCDACNKSCRSCYYYSCKDCDFNLDTKCVSRLEVSRDDGHQHTFVPLFKQVQFTCEGCGEEGKEMGFVCSKCQLLTHTRCAFFSPTIKIAGHKHFLTLSYSIQKEKEQASMACEMCCKEVNTKYAAYYCQYCSYVAHLRCSRDCQIGEGREATNKSASNNINQLFSEGYMLGLIKDMNQEVNEREQPKKIQHFSHPHDLILNHEEVPNNKVCDACMHLISIPFYRCLGCNYFLHCLCTTIPKKHTMNFSHSTFTVSSQAPTLDGVFQCIGCDHYRHGFNCFREGEKVFLDIQCLKMEEFQHKGHQHPFALRRSTTCKFCGRDAFLVCSRGEFALCCGCITLPLVISHKDDEHLLELTYKVEDTFEEHYCVICEGKRDPKHWFYYCEKCNFSGHPQCVLGEFSYIKIGKNYKDERHQHPLTFVRKINDTHPCDACGLPFGEVILQCEECKFKIHPRFGSNSSACLKSYGKE